MEQTPSSSHRRRRWIALVVASTIVGALAAAINVGALQLPGTAKPELQYSTAVTHLMVDYGDPSITRRRADASSIATLVKRTELVGRVIVSPPVLDALADRLGVAHGQVGGLARTTASVPLALIEPASEQRANDILESKLDYRLEVQARPTSPILDIYTQAPTTEQAVALADGAVTGARDYLVALEQKEQVGGSPAVFLRQLGQARGGPSTGGAPIVIAGLTLFTGFGLAFAALLGIGAVLARRARAAAGPARPTSEPAPAADDVLPDDWPHTKRMLPWTFAVFIAVLWLVPFDSIELGVHAPIDLKFDRLVLPLVVAAWVLALMAGGVQRPRLRLTPIHVAVGAFCACAALSVVLNARYLNEIAELDLAFKKLPLLMSYTALFIIASTGLRATEARAFMTFTFVLAVVMALGIIWEYRFKQNLFYQWSDKFLPGPFNVTTDSETALDSLGRRTVRGPTGTPLEAVTLLAMALPIGLVRLLSTAPDNTTKRRLLYALGCCALMAAIVATNRKSGFLVPVSVVATLAYFRRRELLRLAPLGLLLIVFVSALSPGALGSTFSQFVRSDRSAVPTTGDRVSDYDAIRPDVWSHFALGRGWGSYNHESYRILDSEILHRLVEMGVLGLASFLLMGVAVVASARKTIAQRDEEWAPLALMGASAAVAFFAASTLFDIISFPHAAYVFLYIAGLTAVVVGRPRPRAATVDVVWPRDDERPAVPVSPRHPVGAVSGD